MIINKQEQWVFISIPKCCTKSFYKLLRTVAYKGKLYPASWGGGTHNNIVPEFAKEFYKFCVVRSPYTRAVSLWYFTRGRLGINHWAKDPWTSTNPNRWKGLFPKGWTLEDEKKDLIAFTRWLTDGCTDPNKVCQTKWLQNCGVVETLRFESIAESWRSCPVNKGTPLPRIGSTDVWKRRSWKDYVTDAFLEAVWKWAEPDFEAYGYDQDRQANCHCQQRSVSKAVSGKGVV